MVSAPFMENFMFPVPEASLPAWNLLGEIRSRVNVVAVLDVEIREKGHGEPPRHIRVVVDLVRHGVDQLMTSLAMKYPAPPFLRRSRCAGMSRFELFLSLL